MEKNLKIKVSKNVAIYGKLLGSLDQPLIIVVHGLPCNMDDFFYASAARWFSKQGFASFRFNLYDWRPNARQLIDCTLKTHASDFDVVVRYFRRKGVKKICVAGHSYGGPTILLSKNKNFDAVALWDPSHESSFTKAYKAVPAGKYIRILNGYFMRWGVSVILGKDMVKEADALPWDGLTKNFDVPLLIIAAGKGVLVKGAKHYYKKATEPKSLEIIPGATHYFDDKEGMQEDVFKRSKNWFLKYL